MAGFFNNMGVYAQSNIEIICKNNKVAKKVAKIIKDKAKKTHMPKDEDFNYQFESLEVGDNYVYLFKSSGRYQNLEYQCEVLWKLIEGIDGVLEMNCPFLSEADGMYFDKDTELICTHEGCTKLQVADGEFCEKHIKLGK